MAETALEKLKKIMLVADRMRQDQMRRILGLNEQEFDDNLLNWALQFGFRIDGADVVFIGGDVKGFIGEQDRQFKQWSPEGAGKKEDIPPLFKPPPLTVPIPTPPEVVPVKESPDPKSMPESLRKLLLRREMASLEWQKKRDEEMEKRLETMLPEVQSAIGEGNYGGAKSILYNDMIGNDGPFNTKAKQLFWEIQTAEEAACLKPFMPELRDLQEGKTRPDAPVFLKLLLVGESAVGKTAFLLKYLNDTFVANTSMTIVADISVKKITFKARNVICMFYDLGPGRFMDFYPAFIPGAHGAMLFYDTTRMQSVDPLEEWVNLCRAHDKTLPILLCGTKSDLENERSISPEYVAGLLQPLGLFDIYETSAKTGWDVTAAVEALLQEILKKSHQI